MPYKQEPIIDIDSHFIDIFTVNYRKSPISTLKNNFIHILLHQGKKSQYDDSLEILFLFISL